MSVILPDETMPMDYQHEDENQQSRS